MARGRKPEKEETHNKIVRNKMFISYHNDPLAKTKSLLKYYKRMLKGDEKALAILNNPSAKLEDILEEIKTYYKLKQTERKIAMMKAKREGSKGFSLDF